jgi:hypothetical protein
MIKWVDIVAKNAPLLKVVDHLMMIGDSIRAPSDEWQVTSM